jgi:hypothetical protein
MSGCVEGTDKHRKTCSVPTYRRGLSQKYIENRILDKKTVFAEECKNKENVNSRHFFAGDECIFKEDTRIGLKKVQIVYYVQRCANTSLNVIYSTVYGKKARRVWLVT